MKENKCWEFINVCHVFMQRMVTQVRTSRKRFQARRRPGRDGSTQNGTLDHCFRLVWPLDVQCVSLRRLWLNLSSTATVPERMTTQGFPTVKDYPFDAQWRFSAASRSIKWHERRKDRDSSWPVSCWEDEDSLDRLTPSWVLPVFVNREITLAL